MIGLYKTELIYNMGPWAGLDDVEFGSLEWVDWWNNRRLLEPIGMILPAEAEAALLPTKIQPRGSSKAADFNVTIVIPRSLVEVRQVTVDDLDSFSAVRDIQTTEISCEIPEKEMKEGIQAIIREPGEFRDWGGEKNDLWTTRMRLDGGRRPTAFAFKGPGTRGKLTPKKMGTHGDQIQRLFTSEADG